MRAAVVLAVLLAFPAAASGRVIQAESVLPPGQSGTVPQSGDNPHLDDQVALFKAFRFKPAGFDQPGTTESFAPGITITRDAYGVPSVRATTDERLWTGVGYAIAQDRLVQLELFRRSTTGTLAAVLGRGSLESDVAARRDYYTERERLRMLARLPAQLRARFYAYATGINLWLARLRADPSLRPAELVALGLDPADWGATDLAAIGAQIARTTPSDDGRELENWQALRRLGARRFDRLLPLRRAGQVASVPASEGRFPSTPGRTRRDERIGYRRVGTIAQQRPLLTERLAAVDRGLTGGARDVLERVRAWNGSYHTVHPATNTVDPGVVAWEALKDAAVRRLPRAARSWLGGPSVNHQFDFGGADATAFLTLSNRQLRRAAAEAARALAGRFGSTDPASRREPRRMYEVEPLGLAPAPALRFYDRGTWQQAVALGPGRP